MLRRNSRRGARRNIVFHYDLGNDFYALWLDKSMSYSSALFIDPENVRENLKEAQERKIAAILDRLDLGEGDRLLEIGCGWGGLAQSALERKLISYDGLTHATRQKTLDEEKLEADGLSDRSTILLTDYRDAVGQYDAIDSVDRMSTRLNSSH